MEFRTKVDIGKANFLIGACEEMLFVGSCFADAIGRRFQDEGFPARVNPYGTMYNPASILHTIQRLSEKPDGHLSDVQTVFLTLGTNHVYRLRETGEIVDNCQKRPAALFQEEQLSVEACADYLRQVVALLHRQNPHMRVVFTVSPIRYRKYGYHESQLSKATLLLAVEQLQASAAEPQPTMLSYFPAYEILMDELRDYRFYAADMLHPSQQAVDYIWERLVETRFSTEAQTFLNEWRPVRQALSHRPFQADSEAYRQFRQQTLERLETLCRKYPKLKYDTV